MAGVDLDQTRAVLQGQVPVQQSPQQAMELLTPCAGNEMLTLPQVVAVVGSRMLSVFDGTTEYRLGKPVVARRALCSQVAHGLCLRSLWLQRQDGVFARGLLAARCGKPSGMATTGMLFLCTGNT